MASLASGVVPTEVEPSAQIALRGVDYVFERKNRPSNEVLHDVNLSVDRGEFVTIIGASGCGKTTLLRVLAGLLRPTAGTVEVAGRRLSGPSGSTSVVFQSDRLLPWRTVADNIRFGCEIQGKPLDRADLAGLIDRVGLSGYADRWPKELSGGMRQRVNLARALATEPDVLLMDEPFAALDAQTREEMQQELLEIWQTRRTTVVFVTHQIDEALFLGDRVLVMTPRPGQIAAESHVRYSRPRHVELKYERDFQDKVRELWNAMRSKAPSEAEQPTADATEEDEPVRGATSTRTDGGVRRRFGVRVPRTRVARHQR